mmetsp:Transcript_32903/g.50327  ORF Transcript_32903/g.50327 Transcript_32903/m.50327 type:complete len:166 (+) Transcript_32903:401-898(+)
MGTAGQYKSSNHNFRGGNQAMGGHVFKVPAENPPPEQFIQTQEALEHYVSTGSVKSRKDMIHLVRLVKEAEVPAAAEAPVYPSGSSEQDKAIRLMKAISDHDRRVSDYEQNKMELWAVVWVQCSTAMQSVIKSKLRQAAWLSMWYGCLQPFGPQRTVCAQVPPLL